MAQYKGDLRGGKGEVSRLGHKTSGIRCWVRGWNSGIEVEGRWNEETQQDEFLVWVTGGSGTSSTKLLGTLTEDGNFVIIPRL